uniref:Signal recognition particle subunit SRP68 n=1 Tax=Plectus sambesii TaxID=2011161 RepID=A0A914UKZ0_9BILA
MTQDAEMKEEAVAFSTLSLLQLIKESQQQHGLRHGDYQRYRAYCARKIRRIRKSLHWTHAHKSVPKHPAKFSAKKLTADVVTEIRFLQVAVFDAERCWSYAMQLKQEMGEDAASRKKFHMLSKLRKAVKHVTDLDSIARHCEKVDPPTKLEVQAYSAWINGCLHFELKQWIKAMEFFRAAKTIYEKLADAVPNPQLSDLYRARCREMQPQLRYCEFNIGDETAITELMDMRLKIGDDGLMVGDLDKLIAETRAKTSQSDKADIVWGGQKLPIEQPKVKQLMESLRLFDQQLAQTNSHDDKTALYEKLLIECRDAIQAVRDEAKTDVTKARGEDDSPQGPNLLIHSYLNYVRLSRTAERYLLMIEQSRAEDKKAKAQDLIRLYDTVIQNFTEIVALPGATNDSALQTAFNAKIAYYRAFRCFFVAEAYANLKKWNEAASLYDRTLENSTSAAQQLKKAKASPYLDLESVSLSKLSELDQSVNAAKYTAHANRLFATDDDAQNGQTSSDLTVLESLDEYRKVPSSAVASGNLPALLRFPPPLQPMPCKPLFFDLALNHIQMPSLEDKIGDASKSAPSAGAPGQQGNAGLGSMVKGWFWGSGNK